MTDALERIGHDGPAVEVVGPCDYREWRPPSGAPRCVAELWRSDVRASGPIVLLPDGSVELVRDREGAVVVWGPGAHPRRPWVSAGATYVGVRLRPGTAVAVLGVPASALADAVVHAQEIPCLRGLGADAADAWLARILALVQDGDADWSRDLVARHGPRLVALPGATVPAVATSLGLSERGFRRRFRESVGLSPSTYRRLTRARNALRDLHDSSRSPASIADAAHRHGFSDHAHLTRTVATMTGLPPRALLDRARATRSG